MGGREFTIRVDNPDGSGLVAIGPDDEIPDWARKLVDKRHLNGPHAAADDGEPFDPSDHTVDEVNDYLSGDDVDEDEVARVLAAEGAEEGKQRAGILNGPHAAADDGEPFDPSDHTVDEVNDYLSGDDVDEDEVARVLAAEGAEEGKQRAGILNGPHAAA